MVVSQLCYTWEQATLEVLKFNLGSKANGYKTIIIYFYCFIPLCVSLGTNTSLDQFQVPKTLNY